MNYRNPKILKSAKGAACTIRSPWCNGDTSTTVAAHSDYQEHGKGKGLKAHDCFVAYACARCHDWIHRSAATRAEKYDAFCRGMHRTWLVMLRFGILR